MQIWKSLSPELIICSLIIATGYAATDELTAPTPPNGMTCFCPGDQLNYTCTIVGGIVTVWDGTAFNCSDSANQLPLFHNQIGAGTPRLGCNSGSIVGRGLSVVNNTGTLCYTSELLITASSDLNGRTVECSRDTTLTPIDSITLQIAGPPLAPTNIMATEISQSSFTVTWTPPTNQCGSTLTYQINSTDCGTCTVNTGTPSASCTNWTPNGQNCTVRVRTVSCRVLTGVFSDSLTVTLREPDPPAEEDVTIRSKYSQSNGLLSAIEVSFPPVEPVEVTPSLTPPITYSVKLNNDLRTLTCNTSVCMIVVTDPPTTDVIQVSVIVSNGLGSGKEVMYPTTVPRNVTTGIVDVDVTVTNTSATVTGVLASSFLGSTSLRVDYRLSSGGELLSATSAMTGSSGDTLTVVLTSLQVGVSYEYSVFVNHGGLLVEVSGTFSSSCLLEDLVEDPTSPTPDSITPMICTSDTFSNGFTILNGVVCYTGKNPDSQPSDYSQTFCNEGYELDSGSPIARTCQRDGTWSGSLAQCVLTASTACGVSCTAGSVVGVIVILALGAGGTTVTVIVIKKKKDSKSKNPKSVEEGPELISNSPSTEHKTTPPAGGGTMEMTATSGGGEYDTVGFVGTTGGAYEDVDAQKKQQRINKGQGKKIPPTEIIVHETAPTGELYAVVDKRASKKKTGDPPPPGSIYQDPNTIEHETTDTGDMYAVVDKPKRKSKKQPGAPDVVPDNKSSDLMYADIDVAKVNRKNPRAPIPHQAHPGTVGSVDYATINTNI